MDALRLKTMRNLNNKIKTTTPPTTTICPSTQAAISYIIIISVRKLKTMIQTAVEELYLSNLLKALNTLSKIN